MNGKKTILMTVATVVTLIATFSLASAQQAPASPRKSAARS